MTGGRGILNCPSLNELHVPPGTLTAVLAAWELQGKGMQQALLRRGLTRSLPSLLSVIPTKMSGGTPPVEERRAGSLLSSPSVALHLTASISKK